MIKEKGGRKSIRLPYQSKLLCFDGASGANASAGAAGHASIGVDLVLGIALSDSANGALPGAGAAGYASVSDLVGHGDPPFSSPCREILSVQPHQTARKMAGRGGVKDPSYEIQYNNLMGIFQEKIPKKLR